MGTEKVQKILRTIGLTGKETELYIFLARHGALRSGEIAKGIRTHRVEVYRMLKSLQTKGVVQATLESPTRHTVVPLETLLDSLIMAKREETALMESTRQSVLNDWKYISKIEPKATLEKFVVVEGNRKIYSKILQLTKQTRNHLSVLMPVSGLARAEQYGFFDTIFNHPLKDRIKFRFLTELTNKNMNSIRALITRSQKAGMDVKGKNPNLGLKLSPRMAVRDEEEILLFIRPAADWSTVTKKEVCLWTDCRSIVQSFSAVFDDLWNNSTDIDQRIAELEEGKVTPTISSIDEINIASKTYDEVISSAEKEVIMMTSLEGLIESRQRIALLSELSRKGVAVKIMAPVTRENWHAVQELSRCCSVRHMPAVSLESTIVDGKHLIQSKIQPAHDGKRERIPYFGTLATSNVEYVKKTKNTLDEMWRKASVISVTDLDFDVRSMPVNEAFSVNESVLPKPDGPLRKFLLDVKPKHEAILEKEVLNEIINGTKYPAENWPKDIVRSYGSNGLAIIHPPVSFNLPDMTIWAMHLNKQSSFGAADALLVSLWLETSKGNAYVPVALISDNPRQVEFHKMISAKTPSEHNSRVVNKDELQIRVHGNTMFAGWTVPISLLPHSRNLPPACIMFEGYGPLTTTVVEFKFPSGVKVISEANGFDAFVTFFHPASKYSGPGTDGRLNRDLITTMHPP